MLIIVKKSKMMVVARGRKDLHLDDLRRWKDGGRH